MGVENRLEGPIIYRSINAGQTEILEAAVAALSKSYHMTGDGPICVEMRTVGAVGISPDAGSKIFDFCRISIPPTAPLGTVTYASAGRISLNLNGTTYQIDFDPRKR